MEGKRMLWKGGNKMNLYILGGDARIGFMAEALQKEGYAVSGLGLMRETIPEIMPEEGIPEADAVILGVPCTRDGQTVFAPFYNGLLPLELVRQMAAPGKPVLCGMATGELHRRFAAADIPLIDYFAREELAILNAVPTAEGAIEIAMREMPVTIWGAKCLVTGFGRIGKYLAQTLKALGADVTVSVRKPRDHAACRIGGLKSVETAEIRKCVSDFDVVFNTVPHLIFDGEVLSAMQQGTLLIDLASKPGGVDRNAAETFGIPCIWALSLPGKVAPRSAGEILCETVKNILIERNL